ncbi:MAG: zinc ribbon domain-containing protein [Synergistaceae bacterium]|nr:zinc ribbon domain-containing protein [Synergistaceae bacterium]MBR0168397.1 zinc ribbon domain-containing protein [Synergistaceae bacterium]MBR0279279.1 zinc ribbon domain-containing protein [Synergistaceae bacterium]
MKKCPACGIQYQDSQDFCSKCGAKLEAASPAFEVIDKPKERPDFSDWGGIVLGIIAFFISWEESILFGAIIAVGGIVYGYKSRYGLMRVGAYVINTIVLLISALALLAN